jgi:hypothetical protein
MQPSQPGPRRKDLRATTRGIPAGRRATHPVRTAYGRRQRERARIAAWTASLTETATEQQEN